MSDNLVYFIADAQGRIKIGSSNKPLRRLKNLQCAHADTLTLLATESGGVQREHKLQRQFAHVQIAREWFEPDDALMTHIDSLGCIPVTLESAERALKLGIYGKYSQGRSDLLREHILQQYGVL